MGLLSIKNMASVVNVSSCHGSSIDIMRFLCSMYQNRSSINQNNLASILNVPVWVQYQSIVCGFCFQCISMCLASIRILRLIYAMCHMDLVPIDK